MMEQNKKLRLVIIGAGIAGVSAAEAAHKAKPDTEILLISAEEVLPYFRMNLTRYMAGELEKDRLFLHKPDWYEKNEISLKLGTRVESIDPEKHLVKTDAGDEIGYDKLILTAGAHPFVPPFSGKEKRGVQTVRTLDDADLILEICKDDGEIVCIGGGLLGLEMAGAIAARGAKVTVVEALDWLLPRQLDKTASKILTGHIERLGIKVIVPGRTSEIYGEGMAEGIRLDDQTDLPAKLVVVSTGVAPNLELARSAGLEVNRGVVVSDRMETSVKDIFAAGDIVEHQKRVYGLWAPAKAMGTVAGKVAVGQEASFPGDPPSTKLKVLGIDMFSVGQFAPSEERDMLVNQVKDGNYASFLFRNNKMIGSILLGDASLSAEVKDAVEQGRDFSQLLHGKPSVDEVKASLTAKAEA